MGSLKVKSITELGVGWQIIVQHKPGCIGLLFFSGKPTEETWRSQHGYVWYRHPDTTQAPLWKAKWLEDKLDEHKGAR